MAVLPNNTPAVDRVTFSGVFGEVAGPAEIWNWTANFEPSATAETLENRVAFIHDAWAMHLAPVTPSYVHLTRVRLAQVKAGGHVETRPDGSFFQADDVRAAVGTQSTSVVYPLQVALCVTFATGRPGPSGRGRAFLPMPAYSLGPTFSINDANAGAFVGAFRSFINRIQGQDPAGAPLAPPAIVAVNQQVVASRKGFRSAVTGYKVGHAPDTMNTRRNRLPELYVSLPKNSGAT